MTHPLRQDCVAVEQKRLGCGGHGDASLIGLNPAVREFQKIIARDHLPQAGGGTHG